MRLQKCDPEQRQKFHDAFTTKKPRKLIMFFRTRTLKAAMNALRQTEAPVVDMQEYFPTPASIRAELGTQFDVMGVGGWKKSLSANGGAATPERCAYHLLDYIGRLLQRDDCPNIGGWCLSARDRFRRGKSRQYPAVPAVRSR